MNKHVLPHACKATLLNLVFLCCFTIIHNTVCAQALGYNNNRIACSADGNAQPDLEYTGRYNYADPDDWGATPAALAMIAKLQLQGKLVHYSYNNFMPSPAHTSVTNHMKEGVDGSVARYGFDRSVFFDVGTQKEDAIHHLKNELLKSSETNPLYFIHMGPSEFFYQVVKRTIEQGGIDALSYVYVISHSGYNDNHLRRPNHHTMRQAISLSEGRIHYKKIKDQNSKNLPHVGWSSLYDWSVWDWLKNHKNPDIAWLWTCMKRHKEFRADISDAGMVFYMLTGDEDGNPEKFKAFLGDSI